LLTPAQVNDILTAIDAVPDPQGASARYVTHVRGPAKDQPPTESTKFENRARQWMFDQEWLNDASNWRFDVPNRIVDSGKLWGDEVDPEEIMAKAKLVLCTKKGLKKVKVEIADENDKENLLAQLSAKSKGKQKVSECVDMVTSNPGSSSWASYMQ
jgi:hypothetical protein